MKAIFKTLPFAVIAMSFIYLLSCQKEVDGSAVLTTTEASEITPTTAVTGGNITAVGGSAITARGVCWDTAANPTVNKNKTSDSLGLGIFKSKLSKLTPKTKYYVRAYATSGGGTSYGNEISFETNDVPVVVSASVVTTAMSEITANSASSGGTVTEGSKAVYAHGVCWSITPTPTIANNKTNDGSGAGSYTSRMTGLAEKTTYYVRAYAIDSLGISYGDELSYTTSVALTVPIVTTLAIADTTQTSASCGGNITSDGNSTVTARGVCWSTTQSPSIANNTTTDGSGIGSFTSAITGLAANTKYYVRAYATNSEGTAYGSEVSFTTLAVVVSPSSSTVTDVDGNIYNTVTIGNQTWMKENLKTTKYNDGGAIALVTDQTQWNNLTTPAYCYYNNDEAKYKSKYGALYNGYVVVTAKVCPTGWHIPSEEEWTILEDYLGGSDVAGGKMKEAGADNWLYSNQGTNSSNFTALPAGMRKTYDGGYFSDLGTGGFLWTSSGYDAQYNYCCMHNRYIFSTTNSIGSVYSALVNGYSIRCLKD